MLKRNVILSGVVLLSLSSQVFAMWNGTPATYRDDLAHMTVAVGVSLSALDPSSDNPIGLGPYTAFCSSTLIAPHTALTAAHCLSGGTALQVQTNQLKILVGPQTVEHALNVKQALIGPSYDPAHPEKGDDIALIYFNDAIPNSYYEATLAPAGSVLTASSVITAGYGQAVIDSPNFVGQDINPLRFTTNKIIDAQSLFWGVIIDETTGGPCSGDSGGPAFLTVNGKLELVGVNESVTDGDCEHESIFTKIDPYRAWIESNLQ